MTYSSFKYKHTFRVVSCDLPVAVFFLSWLKFSSSNCYPLICFINVSLTSILVNPKPFYEMSNFLNLYSKVWISLIKGRLVTLKQAKVPTLTVFLTQIICNYIILMWRVLNGDIIIFSYFIHLCCLQFRSF